MGGHLQSGILASGLFQTASGLVTSSLGAARPPDQNLGQPQLCFQGPALVAVGLQPFLADSRSWLGVADESTWQRLLSVDPGQPFRLHLWHALSLIVCDPDSDFFADLHEVGIGSEIPACKVLLPPDSPDIPTIPLQHCESAWKSALDNPTAVDDLLQTEVQEGWIRPGKEF